MWSLAIKTLVADRGKLITALVGVVFSIVLMNIQGGLFLGLVRRAGLLVDFGQADIWVGHKQMHNVDLPRDVPRRWVNRIRPVPGVKRAEPYLVGFSEMSLPSGGFEGVTVIGADGASLLGNAWNIHEGHAAGIRRPDGIIVDFCENAKLENPEVGELREIGGRRTRIVAKSQGIVGFLVAPYVFTNYAKAAEILRKPEEVCSYLLIQLEPGADVEEARQAIRERLPEAEVLTREQYSRISVNFWMTRTGMGISFGAATLLGLLVGLVMVGQTLYALVLDRLAEFGTLKAIGAVERQIHSILLVQAVTMALVGSLMGLAIVAVLQSSYSTPHAPISIPQWLAWGSCVLVLGICLVASLLPYLRIRKVDPLMVLQS